MRYNQGNGFWDMFSQGLLAGYQKGQEQKQEAGLYNGVADFAEDLTNLDYGGQTSMQDLASRANPNSNYTNKTASLKAQQGLLPTSFNQSVPTSDTLGQGLLGMPKQQVEQQPQRFFIDPNIATDMQPDTTPLLGKYAKENNPVNITTSAPKTLQEQTRMIKTQQGQAMRELIAKGYSPKEILPLLQQATNDKISEHTAIYQQNQVNELYQGFVNEENPNKKAMYAARLKQAGYDVTTPYKEFAPEYKAERFDNGNSNDAYSFNPKTGKYELQVSMAKGVSPDAQLRADTSITTASMRRAAGGSGGSRSTGGGGNYGDGGRKTGTTKQLDPIKVGQYSTRYQEILADIWDTKTAKDRSALVNQYTDELNALGQALDKDVENDIDYIINTNPRGQ